jgi:hypothetical protein
MTNAYLMALKAWSAAASQASPLYHRWAQPGLNSLDLGWVHGYAVVKDDVDEVGDRRLAKGALALLTSKLVLS